MNCQDTKKSQVSFHLDSLFSDSIWRDDAYVIYIISKL